jgi:hypothetical protein
VDIVKQGNMKTLSPSEMATKTLIACNTIILSELLNDAEENQIEKYCIKKLLECFNPLIENEIEQMKKHMFEYSGYELDNILTYKSAIEFVTNNDKDDITETDLGELAEILIAAIKNRMTKYCEDCKNWYSVHRKDKPNRECVMCKVGQHDCSTEKTRKKGQEISGSALNAMDNSRTRTSKTNVGISFLKDLRKTMKQNQ